VVVVTRTSIAKTSTALEATIPTVPCRTLEAMIGMATINLEVVEAGHHGVMIIKTLTIPMDPPTAPITILEVMTGTAIISQVEAAVHHGETIIETLLIKMDLLTAPTTPGMATTKVVGVVDHGETIIKPPAILMDLPTIPITMLVVVVEEAHGEMTIGIPITRTSTTMDLRIISTITLDQEIGTTTTQVNSSRMTTLTTMSGVLLPNLPLGVICLLLRAMVMIMAIRLVTAMGDGTTTRIPTTEETGTAMITTIPEVAAEGGMAIVVILLVMVATTTPVVAEVGTAITTILEVTMEVTSNGKTTPPSQLEVGLKEMR
jgi:hypothetical protein